ncbi:ABC transporter substrate-binding protein [Methanoculleus sp. FWC-SCC1]|uniref:ABC transporter substrate-binding protein n=1 Tax=Methanoculleus frigidifontis TaxID=2584085 RepID=A0ABT8M8X3_9EURY|nr:ABC transporter substrate-binding protein [Methanoculleus sp. FWC-SCC1]MDN7024383.1 ABC transporter substrate-binding protein [Methanoculleus sp. FWC-SCC1]
MKPQNIVIIVIAACICIALAAAVLFAAAAPTTDGGVYETETSDGNGWRTVTDMRGVEVTVPEDPQRVVAISRSLIDTTMYIFGVEDSIVGGSIYQKPLKEGEYVWNGTDYTVSTWIGKVLNPGLDDLPNVGGFGGPYGPPNVETIAGLNPDLLILRDLGDQQENTEMFLTQIESAGIPAVVLKYPACYENPRVDTMYEEVLVLGEVFGKEAEAKQIVETINSRVEFIRSRTKDIPQEEQKRVLYFGAPTWAKDKGGSGYAFGSGTPEMAMMEDIVAVRSAYTESGMNMISAEQLLALDPDVIILCTWSGYHPPRQLYEDEQYGAIQDLRALKEGEVYSLAATPCKSERLEFPINLMIMAKAVYPDRFSDVDLKLWIREYIVELYGTDENTTDQVVDALMLEYLEII